MGIFSPINTPRPSAGWSKMMAEPRPCGDRNRRPIARSTISSRECEKNPQTVQNADAMHDAR